jgi:hypothetical protein
VIFNKWKGLRVFLNPKKFMKKLAMFVLIGGAAMLVSRQVLGCACGCGVFDVGASSMLPQDSGGMAFFQYTFQDQNQNWHADSRAPAGNNDDKDLLTQSFTLGGRYMFNRSWGIQVQVPYDHRYFQTLGGATGSQLVGIHWNGFGDVRIQGLYTGLSSDMSSGLTFGVKLPTGSFTHEDAYGDIDRDTELGTGSTDILLGGYYRHNLDSHNNWTLFTQLQLDIPVLSQDQYRPGVELDTAAGIYYKGWMLGHLQLTPMAQVIATERAGDSGAYAAGEALDEPGSGQGSGYQRILLSPGVELDYDRWSLYADVEVPVFRDVTGNQLVSPWMVKMNMTFRF